MVAARWCRLIQRERLALRLRAIRVGLAQRNRAAAHVERICAVIIDERVQRERPRRGCRDAVNAIGSAGRSDLADGGIGIVA